MRRPVRSDGRGGDRAARKGDDRRGPRIGHGYLDHVVYVRGYREAACDSGVVPVARIRTRYGGGRLGCVEHAARSGHEVAWVRREYPPRITTRPRDDAGRGMARDSCGASRLLTRDHARGGAHDSDGTRDFRNR